MSFDVDLRTHEIVRNAVRCHRCNQVIESNSIHDYRRCKCGATAVDGGHRYLARSGADFEELAVVRPRS